MKEYIFFYKIFVYNTDYDRKLAINVEDFYTMIIKNGDGTRELELFVDEIELKRKEEGKETFVNAVLSCAEVLQDE